MHFVHFGSHDPHKQLQVVPVLADKLPLLGQLRALVEQLRAEEEEAFGLFAVAVALETLYSAVPRIRQHPLELLQEESSFG